MSGGRACVFCKKTFVRLNHLRLPEHLRHLDEEVCGGCLGDIIRSVLEGQNYSDDMQAAMRADFCWHCGFAVGEKKHMLRLGKTHRDVHICDGCCEELKSEAFRRAGIPMSWATLEHLCTTCFHERDGICRRDPPVVVVVTKHVGEQYVSGVVVAESKQPYVDHYYPRTGCDTGWTPKLSREDGR